jgi:hypothetical protein
MLSEARGLLLRGWSLGAQARDDAGSVVAAWSERASSWSLLGALLASWHHYHEDLNEDVVGHSTDARALGDATEALGEATGTAGLDQWNDAPGRSLAEVVAAVDRALELLPRRALLPSSQRPREHAQAS